MIDFLTLGWHFPMSEFWNRFIVAKSIFDNFRNNDLKTAFCASKKTFQRKNFFSRELFSHFVLGKLRAFRGKKWTELSKFYSTNPHGWQVHRLFCPKNFRLIKFNCKFSSDFSFRTSYLEFWRKKKSEEFWNCIHVSIEKIRGEISRPVSSFEKYILSECDLIFFGRLVEKVFLVFARSREALRNIIFPIFFKLLFVLGARKLPTSGGNLLITAVTFTSSTSLEKIVTIFFWKKTRVRFSRTFRVLAKLFGLSARNFPQDCPNCIVCIQGILWKTVFRTYFFSSLSASWWRTDIGTSDEKGLSIGLSSGLSRNSREMLWFKKTTIFFCFFSDFEGTCSKM